jgi:hypothetical protein
MTIIHHELCFGCGRTNLFGLLFEGSRAPDGTVLGRWFTKQDHQGPERGTAHPGLVATAMVEAMMLAGGEGLALRRLEFELAPEAAVAVGSFCEVRARVRGRDPLTVTTEAVASVADQAIARASAEYACEPAGPKAGTA